MADGSVAITPGTGVNVDIRTEDVNGDARQVVVVGDPATGAGVAPVDATAGLKVNLGADNDVTVTGTLTGVTTVSTVSNVATIGTSVTPGTAAANLGKAEDAAHVSGDTGVMALAVRKDTAASLAGTDGDYIPLTTDSTGNLRTNTGITQYAEDAAHSSGDNGFLNLAVRRDANTSLVSSDGDYAPVQVDSSGSLKVAITSGAGSGGTSISDEGAFTEGSTSVTPIGGYYNSSEDAIDSGDVAAIGIDSARNIKTHEQYAPTAEDNTNQVIAQQIRPVYGSTYAAPLTSAIFGTDVDLSVKATAGNLLSIYATNINAAVRYLQIHNKATAPTSSNVPVLSLPIPAGSATVPGTLKLGREMFGEGGKYLSTGVAIGISTTGDTFTAATTTDHYYYLEAV